MHHAAEDGIKVDVNERGAARDGQPQLMNRRLFMQLLVFDCQGELGPEAGIDNLAAELSKREASAVIYQDVSSPRGIGLLSWSEDPTDFIVKVRSAVIETRHAALRQRPSMTMFGRTYSSGYEQNLEYWLLDRPRDTAKNAEWPWAVWYPLRRTGAFEQLSPREKGGILREHAEIGKAYGTRDLAHDIRLACHGLDAADNEFVIGLVGKDLHPLSHVVQRMRGTQQTSKYIAQMGPFFVGHVAWRSDK